jgi:hypothetical protein
MTTMHNTPTIADTANLADATSQAACTATTWPPMSSNRFAGMLWSEKMMSQARAASSDAERFMKGL